MSKLKLRIFSFVLLLFVLTGCVRYDVGINFHDQHHGEIIQHITLGQQLTSLSQSESNKWLNSLEKRARDLQGSTKKLSAQEIVVTIPFNNSGDLIHKFNRFFSPEDTKPNNNLENTDLIQFKTDMTVRQSNLLLAERNELNLTVDLTALGVLSNQGNIIISPGSLLNLDLALNTPWGSQVMATGDSLTPDIDDTGKQLIWHLIPGQVNKLNAAFWLPSWLGIGTVGIILFIILGFYGKYRHLPGF